MGSLSTIVRFTYKGQLTSNFNLGVLLLALQSTILVYYLYAFCMFPHEMKIPGKFGDNAGKIHAPLMSILELKMKAINGAFELKNSPMNQYSVRIHTHNGISLRHGHKMDCLIVESRYLEGFLFLLLLLFRFSTNASWNAVCNTELLSEWRNLLHSAGHRTKVLHVCRILESYCLWTGIFAARRSDSF